MQHYERLQRLTSEGDPSAASTLRQEAARRADLPALVLSSAALGERGVLIAEACAAWADAAWQRLDAFSSALGLSINQDTALRIDALIQATNKRLKRRVTHAHILNAISEALTSKTPFSALNTGFGSGGARSVVVLAVSNPDHTLTLGIASAPAQSASPGSAWPAELRPWRPELPQTQARLQAWSANTAATDRLRLPRTPQPRAEAFTLLSRAIPPDTHARAWSDKLYKAARGPLSRAKWRQLCLLLQDPADPEAAKAFIHDFCQRHDLMSPSGDAAWLKDALAVGDKALPHWHHTRALSLDGPSALHLTRTCAAMEGLHEVFLDHTHFQDPNQHTKTFACLATSPYLPSLNLLHVRGARVNLESAHILWGGAYPQTFSTLRRLVLTDLGDLPAAPWPLLEKPLAVLSLLALKGLDMGEALRWLCDSPVKPVECALSGGVVSAPEARLDLPGIRRLTLQFQSMSPHQDADSAARIAALIGCLNLPDLQSLTLHVPQLSNPLIDALDALNARIQAPFPGLSLYVGQSLVSHFTLHCDDLACFAPQPWHAFHGVLRAKLCPRWRMNP